MFYKNFLDLCIKSGKKPNQVTKDLGLSTATATNWKQGSVPRDVTLLQIASYFGVTVDYLLGNEKEKPVAEDELSEEVVIYHRDGKTVKKKFTKEQMRMIAQMLDAIPEEDA